MKIVIEMTEDDYKKVKDGRAPVTMMQNTIRNGTPLPKEHGRLIDADALLDKISKDKREAFTKHQVWLLLSLYNDNAPAIIEADEEVDE